MTSSSGFMIIGGRRVRDKGPWYVEEGLLVFAYQITPHRLLSRPQVLRKGG